MTMHPWPACRFPFLLVLVLLGAAACSRAGPSHGISRAPAPAAPALAVLEDGGPSTDASRAAASQVRESFRGLASGDPKVRAAAAARLDDQVHDQPLWLQAQVELTDAERLEAAGRMAPYLADPAPVVRETILMLMHDLAAPAEGHLPGDASSWLADYGRRLLDGGELGRYETQNRTMLLAMAMRLIDTEAPTPATWAVVRDVAADEALAQAVAAKSELGWASAQGAIEEAQRLEARWSGEAR